MKERKNHYRHLKEYVDNNIIFIDENNTESSESFSIATNIMIPIEMEQLRMDKTNQLNECFIYEAGGATHDNNGYARIIGSLYGGKCTPISSIKNQNRKHNGIHALIKVMSDSIVVFSIIGKFTHIDGVVAAYRIKNIRKEEEQNKSFAHSELLGYAKVKGEDFEWVSADNTNDMNSINSDFVFNEKNAIIKAAYNKAKTFDCHRAMYVRCFKNIRQPKNESFNEYLKTKVFINKDNSEIGDVYESKQDAIDILTKMIFSVYKNCHYFSTDYADQLYRNSMNKKDTTDMTSAFKSDGLEIDNNKKTYVNTYVTNEIIAIPHSEVEINNEQTEDQVGKDEQQPNTNKYAQYKLITKILVCESTSFDSPMNITEKYTFCGTFKQIPKVIWKNDYFTIMLGINNEMKLNDFLKENDGYLTCISRYVGN